jgi:hypothetical protein
MSPYTTICLTFFRPTARIVIKDSPSKTPRGKVSPSSLSSPRIHTVHKLLTHHPTGVTPYSRRAGDQRGVSGWVEVGFTWSYDLHFGAVPKDWLLVKHEAKDRALKIGKVGGLFDGGKETITDWMMLENVVMNMLWWIVLKVFGAHRQVELYGPSIELRQRSRNFLLLGVLIELLSPLALLLSIQYLQYFRCCRCGEKCLCKGEIRPGPTIRPPDESLRAHSREAWSCHMYLLSIVSSCRTPSLPSFAEVTLSSSLVSLPNHGSKIKSSGSGPSRLPHERTMTSRLYIDRTRGITS